MLLCIVQSNLVQQCYNFRITPCRFNRVLDLPEYIDVPDFLNAGHNGINLNRKFEAHAQFDRLQQSFKVCCCINSDINARISGSFAIRFGSELYLNNSSTTRAMTVPLISLSEKPLRS